MKQKLFGNLKGLTFVFSVAILIITIVILILRLTVFGNPKTADTESPENKNKVSASVEDAENLSTNFKYTINDTITFKHFGSTSNPGIKNDASNKEMMQVKLITEDTKTAIYTSMYIKPGISERAITLMGSELPAGSYPCSAEIIVLSEDLTPLTTINTPVTVVIENDVPTNEETPEE